ncbi:MAG: hypothetical protein AAF532_03450 [Planctomycetota bacterium]
MPLTTERVCCEAVMRVHSIGLTAAAALLLVPPGVADGGMYREERVELRPRLDYARYAGPTYPMAGRTVYDRHVVNGESFTERNFRRVEDALIEVDRTLLEVDDALVRPVDRRLHAKRHGRHGDYRHCPPFPEWVNEPYPESLYGLRNHMGPAKRK